MKSKRAAVCFHIFLLIQLSICSIASARSDAEIFARLDGATANVIEQWTEIAYPGSPAFSPILGFFSHGGFLFAATESGALFRSANEGASWQVSGNGLPTGTIVQSFAAIGSVIFIGTDRGVYRSADEGQSWSAANTQLPAVNSVAAVGATQFAGSAGNIFRSTDQGQNWTEFKSGLPDNFSGAASLAAGGSTVFALIGGNVYRLQETGAAWAPANFSGALAIAASGPAVYALKNEGVWRSLDQGQNWTQVFNVPPGIFGSDRATNLAVNGTTLFASVITITSPSATLVSLHYSPDQGRNWFRANPPLLFGPFVSTPITRIFAFGDKVIIVRSDNKIFISPGFYSPGLANVSAASYSPAGVTPEGIVAAFGANLVDVTQSAISIPLPFSLANTTVTIKDSAGIERLAPLFFVSPNQINYQVPPGTAAGIASVTVSHNGAVVGREDLRIERVSPGIFTVNMDGKGLAAAVVLRVKADGSRRYEPVAVFDAQQNKFVPVPIDLGEATDQVYLILFGTGVRNRGNLNEITVESDGLNWPVLYAGEQGEFLGLDQINLLVPRSIAGRGEVTIQLRVQSDGGPLFSNAVTVTIK